MTTEGMCSKWWLFRLMFRAVYNVNLSCHQTKFSSVPTAENLANLHLLPFPSRDDTDSEEWLSLQFKGPLALANARFCVQINDFNVN